MITCVNCGSDKMSVIRWSIVRPDYDLFECRSCKNTQLRYAGTKYETSEEKKERLAQ